MERICIDTLHSMFYGYPSMRVPPESRMVVKRFPSRHPCLSLWERWPALQRGRRANNSNVNRKMLAPSQADDVRGRKALSVTCGDSSPKGEPRHRILAQEMERICIDTLHSLFYGYPSMRVPPESRMVVKRFPSPAPLASPCGRGGQQRGRKRANNGNVNRKMLAPSQADDVPRAQRPSQSPAVTALPKGEPRHRMFHKKWSVSVSIRSIHYLRLPLNACRPKVGWS